MAQKSAATPSKTAETYLLEMDDKTQKRITVPAGCSVTFGALIPGSTTNTGRLGLRVWKGKQQLAVFVDVAAFRSLELDIEERKTTTKQETYTKGNGQNAKAVVVEAVVHEWVNPDKPPERATQPEQRLIKSIDLE